MPFSISFEHGTVTLRLKGAVTIRNAQELATNLRERLQDGAAFTVDAAELEDLDTCVLQLLCSLRKNRPTLSFTSPSVVLDQAIDRCGLRRAWCGEREGL